MPEEPEDWHFWALFLATVLGTLFVVGAINYFLG